MLPWKGQSENSDFCLRDGQSQSKQQAARGYQLTQWVEPSKHLVLCTQLASTIRWSLKLLTEDSKYYSTRLHLVLRRRHQETYEHRTSQRLLVSRHSIFQITSFQQQFLMHPKEILSPEHCFRVCHSTSSCNISSFRIGWHFRDMKIQKRVWVLLMK